MFFTNMKTKLKFQKTVIVQECSASFEGFDQWFNTEWGTDAIQPRARHVSNWINPDSMPPPNIERLLNSPLESFLTLLIVN